MQGVAHLAQPLLEPGKRRRLDAAAALGVKPAAERAHLGLEQLDRAARHRVRDHPADLDQILAQALDRGVGAAFERLGRRTPQVRAGRRHSLAVEHALARRYLGDRLLDAATEGRRAGEGCRRAGALAAELGERLVDAVDALFDRARGAAAFGEDLIEPAVQAQDGVGDAPRRLLARRLRGVGGACRLRRLCGLGCLGGLRRLGSLCGLCGLRRLGGVSSLGRLRGLLALRGAVTLGLGTTAGQPLDLAADVVEPGVDRREVLAAIAAAHLGLVGMPIGIVVLVRGVHLRVIENDGIEPLADGHAGAPGGLTGCLPCLRGDALQMPRRRSHSSTHISRRMFSSANRRPLRRTMRWRLQTGGPCGSGTAIC